MTEQREREMTRERCGRVDRHAGGVSDVDADTRCAQVIA